MFNRRNFTSLEEPHQIMEIGRHFEYPEDHQRIDDSYFPDKHSSAFECLFEPIYRRQGDYFVPAGHKIVSRAKNATPNLDVADDPSTDQSSLDLFRAIEMGMCQIEVFRARLEEFLDLKALQPQQTMVFEVDVFDLDANQENLSKLNDVIEEGKKMGLDPQDVIVEISGTTRLDPGIIYTIAMRLKEVGVRVALVNLDADSFSFKRIFQIWPHIVKFNRSWCEQDLKDPGYVEMVRLLVSSIQSKGIFATLTGVRTSQELTFTAQCGFTRCQGPYLGAPSEIMETGPVINA